MVTNLASFITLIGVISFFVVVHEHNNAIKKPKRKLLLALAIRIKYERHIRKILVAPIICTALIVKIKILLSFKQMLPFLNPNQANEKAIKLRLSDKILLSIWLHVNESIITEAHIFVISNHSCLVGIESNSTHLTNAKKSKKTSCD
jgi:hypothetical protein